MLAPPPTTGSITPANNSIVQGFFSDNGSIMVAAIISLILVIIFVLLLHVYAKWFLVQARQRSARGSVAVPQVMGARRHRFDSFTIDNVLDGDLATKGLESSDISSIPVFVYKVDEHKNGLECAICLSVFEEEEMGRKLPLCGHVFHVDCIDMWLSSHVSCPTCRGEIVIRLDNVCISSPPYDDEGSNHDLLREDISELAESSNQTIMIRSNEDTVLEIVVDAPSPHNENASTRDLAPACCLSSSSVSSNSLLLSDSVKKIVRSRSERKVHPSMDLEQVRCQSKPPTA